MSDPISKAKEDAVKKYPFRGGPILNPLWIASLLVSVMVGQAIREGDWAILVWVGVIIAMGTLISVPAQE